MADHGNAPATFVRQGVGAGLESPHRLFRAARVGQEADASGPVTDLSQPDRHRRERVVAGEEPGQQQDRAAVAPRNPSAAKHWVGEQAGGV
jgi:hypothetical protein